MEVFKEDQRFAHVHRDPRFRGLPKKERKVEIDKRFKGMFDNGKFKLKYTVDKRGRPVHTSTSENLKKYYDLKSESSEDEKEETDGKNKAESKDFDQEEQENNSFNSEETSSEDQSASSDESDLDEDIDYSRGVHLMVSSSEESENEEESDNSEENFEHQWGEMDKDAQRTDEVTSRLALCNMNWDRLKAYDIMAIMNSFKPINGTIKSVHIYPSQFGLERMKAENLQGPAEIVARKQENVDQNSEGSSFEKEKLREYQLNRLKYYYAVITCDKAGTANAIYEQCDGMEYESTGNRIDLRFIPEDMTFEEEATSSALDVPGSATYKPSTFVTSALQQSTVECTWDETDHERIALTRRKFKKDDLEEMDLRDYLASDSDVEGEDPYAGVDSDVLAGAESDSEDDETKINKYKSLLQGLGGEQREKLENEDMEMEITWEPGLKETTEELVKKQHKEKTATPWEQYLEKKKQKKKKKLKQKRNKNEDNGNEEEISDDDIPSDIDLNDLYFKEEFDKMNNPSKAKKEKKTKKKKSKKNKKLTQEDFHEKEEREAELKLLLMDEDDNKRHFNLKQLVEPESKTKRKKLKSKRKAAEDGTNVDDFKLDMADSRFNVLFENPLYNIDPSAPEFKKTKAMDELINEKVKRSKNKNRRQEKELKINAKPTDFTPETKQPLKRKADEISDNLQTEPTPVIKRDLELHSLVKSVKAKTKLVKIKKKLK